MLSIPTDTCVSMRSCPLGSGGGRRLVVSTLAVESYPEEGLMAKWGRPTGVNVQLQAPSV